MRYSIEFNAPICERRSLRGLPARADEAGIASASAAKSGGQGGVRPLMAPGPGRRCMSQGSTGPPWPRPSREPIPRKTERATPRTILPAPTFGSSEALPPVLKLDILEASAGFCGPLACLIGYDGGAANR